MASYSAVPSREADKFVVRFPEQMRERISEVARLNHRSMNSEITNRLDQSLAQDGVVGDVVLRLDDAELSLHERELLMQFRQLTHRQQNALLALIDRSTNPAS